MENNERIKKIAQQALDNIQDDNELFQETIARIKANPTLAPRLEHYNQMYWEDVPADEAFQTENAYWEEVFEPTRRHVQVDVVNTMLALIEEACWEQVESCPVEV